MKISSTAPGAASAPRRAAREILRREVALDYSGPTKTQARLLNVAHFRFKALNVVQRC
jgi:hypothetical protein